MMLAPLLAVAALSGAEIVSETMRPPWPDGLSGITQAGASRYLAVDDTGGRMFSVRFAVDAKKGALGSVVVTNQVMLACVVDAEGVAYDPLRHTVWVADEKGSRLSEHDATTGKRLSHVELPPPFDRVRPGVGVESLAISPDGLTMWTANEEAATGDGNRATRTSGTVVRLQRLSRKSGKGPWKPAGQFAYVVDPMDGGAFRKAARSGLSDLCVLPTGELIALEREFSQKGFLPTFRLRLYRVGLDAATDVGNFDRLEGRRFTPASKDLLLDADTGFSMYEGVCVGPKLADGTQTLLLVSDGDGEAVETLMSVRLLRTSCGNF